MASCRQFSRVDVAELRLRLLKKLGRQKAERYFFHLKKLLSLKLTKLEFDKFCYATIGKENIALHNLFIRSIIGNAFLGIGPLSKQAATGHSGTNRTRSGLFGDVLLRSPRNVRSLTSGDRKYCDRPSPLGSKQEVTNSCDVQPSRDQQPSAPEVRSIGSKALLEVVSVEDGEEVEQVRGSPCVQSRRRSPITAPLGIPKTAGAAKSHLPLSCYDFRHLPDTKSLCSSLKHRLAADRLDVSMDCANVLNNGLDAFLRRLIRPCVDLSTTRSSKRRICQANGRIAAGMNGLRQYNQVMGVDQCHHTSLQDFLVAMESNPQLLGVDWPIQLEKIRQCP